jgi:hypothetical protein
VSVVATTKNIRIPANAAEQRSETISNSNFIFLFLNIETVRIVKPAMKDLKKQIWKALSSRRLNILIKRPPELHINAAKDIYISPFL